MSDLLTPHETAEMLRVSARTLADWRSDGKGPQYVMVGGLVRYWRSDIAEYLDARTIDPKVARA